MKTVHWRNFGFRLLTLSSVLVSLQAAVVVKTTGAESKNYLRIDHFLSAQQTSLVEMQSIRMHEWRVRSDFSSQPVIVSILYKQLHFEIAFFHFYTQFLFYRRVHFLYNLFQRKRKKKSSTVPLNKLTLGECKNCTVDLKQFTYFCFVTVCVCVCEIVNHSWLTKNVYLFLDLQSAYSVSIYFQVVCVCSVCACCF